MSASYYGNQQAYPLKKVTPYSCESPKRIWTCSTKRFKPLCFSMTASYQKLVDFLVNVLNKKEILF